MRLNWPPMRSSDGRHAPAVRQVTKDAYAVNRIAAGPVGGLKVAHLREGDGKIMLAISVSRDTYHGIERRAHRRWQADRPQPMALRIDGHRLACGVTNISAGGIGTPRPNSP